MAMSEVAELPIIMMCAVKVVLICDLISYHYIIYAYMIIYGLHTLGRLGRLPYMS